MAVGQKARCFSAVQNALMPRRYICRIATLRRLLGDKRTHCPCVLRQLVTRKAIAVDRLKVRKRSQNWYIAGKELTYDYGPDYF